MRVAVAASISVVALAPACGGSSRGERVVVVGPDSGGEPSAAPSGGAPDSGAGGQPAGGEGGEGGEAGVGGAPLEREPCEIGPDNSVGNLELVTLGLSCSASDGDALFSRLTSDGRYLAFDSDAGDLIANDHNGKSDVFLLDLQTRELELISQHYEEQRPVQGYSFVPVASSDGRYVAFTSYTYELTKDVPPEGTFVYLRDRQTRTTRRFDASFICADWLDMTPDASVLTADGSLGCFGDNQDTDHDIAVEYQRASGEATYLGPQDGGDTFRPSISSDGRFEVWATRPPGTRGQLTSTLQRYDRVAHTLSTAPVTGFHFGSTDIADSGQVVAFSLYGQVYLFDFETEDLTLVSHGAGETPGDGTSDPVSLSADGRLLVFASTATNLVDDDTNDASDIFLYDAQLDELTRISVAPDGSEADDASRNPSISADGTRVSFTSKARNLVPAATTGNWQVYVLTLPALAP